MKTRHAIALIPGDGIGREVVPAAVSVLEAAGHRFDFDLDWKEYDWSCDRVDAEPAELPADVAQVRLEIGERVVDLVGHAGRSLRDRRASQASRAIPKKARPMAPSASEPSHTSCLRVRAATAPRAMATWKNATASAKRW
jgi:hypothetical protein